MDERKKIPISVLIVDDEPSIVEQLAQILQRRVETLYTASNGEEGLACFKNRQIDLIISDIDMPSMNGIEFLKQVREKNHHIPFIISTGFKNPDILIEAIEYGITAFLPKPLQKKSLIAKIEEFARTKALENEVHQSNLLLDQYRAIVDSSAIVSKTDSRGIITYVNDMFCAISGYAREELIGEPHNIIRDPEMPSSAFREMWETIRSKNIWHGIIHNRKKNGMRYTVKSTIAPILDDRGNIIEYIGLREDITEFQEAKEEAKAAAAMKGEFLANMSHEIRTPMNGILGFSSLLAKSNLNEQQKRYLDIIESSTRSLLGIINDILDFSKLESGKFELDYTNINPFIEFDKMTQLFDPIMKEKEIVFDVMIDPMISECIRIDLLRIQQVVTNLLSNAVKFTPARGHITFYVSDRQERNGEVQLRIGVRDNGIGIPLQQQQKIFEAFSQADSSITRKFGGTGLGLSISSHLVSLMGGALRVQSTEGEGSDFYFEIDVQKCTAEHTLPPFGPKNSVRFIGKILVAEDHDVNRMLIREYLEQYGLDTVVVESGQHALDEMGGYPYDLVFMDVNMPGMRGTDALLGIKERGILTPVVALTANAMEGDKAKFLELGFDGYLSKPIITEQLEAILGRYLFRGDDIETAAQVKKMAVNPMPRQILDMELIRKELPISEAVIYRLLKTFLNSSDASLLALKRAIQTGDAKEIEHSAHYIKGAAGNLRFKPIEMLASELEKPSGTGSAVDYETIFHRMEAMMERVKGEIRELLRHVDSSAS